MSGIEIHRYFIYTNVFWSLEEKIAVIHYI